MARKKKGKTKKNAANNALREPEELSKAPHTFVVQRGHVGNTVASLTQDMRQVMEPYTASNLKLRRKNVLKDMVAIAGPLGVTNFIMFSKTPNGTNMRLARLPRGPTLYFQVEKFSLCHDINSALKRPQTSEGQYRHSPLLVLNNFKDSEEDSNKLKPGDFEANPRKLCMTMLQNMFPSINIHKVKLNHVKRCVSFSYDREKDVIEFRHYHIAAKPMGLSRRLKKLIARKDIPDLGKYGDVSEFLTQNPGEGSASESEAELDGPHNEVELPQNVSGRGNLLNQQSAIRLTELGPRMTLRLVKIEEGMCTGEVLYHSLVVKDKEEIEAMVKRKEEKAKLKAKRKAEQAKNVTKKQELREELKQKSLSGMKRKIDEDSKAELTSSLPEEDDDAEWYRKEVGQEPDEQFYSGKGHSQKSSAKKRKFQGKENSNDANKKIKRNKLGAKSGKSDKAKPVPKSKVLGRKAAFSRKKGRKT